LAKVDKDGELIFGDPLYGEAAIVVKEGQGALSLIGSHLAARFDVLAGTLKLRADQNGRGALIKASDGVIFANGAVLALEPVENDPHVLSLADLKTLPEIRVEANNKTPNPANRVILKIVGPSDLKTLSGRKFSGRLGDGKSGRDYSLTFNDRGELAFELSPLARQK
jgi:hypothetical protein